LEGFSSETLEDILENGPLDRWNSIDGLRPPPEKQRDLLLQEMSYLPEIDDGVRINIAPLQKAGLLAVNVLNIQDLAVAITDRATWRRDERHWCRESRLPKPGWWP